MALGAVVHRAGPKPGDADADYGRTRYLALLSCFAVLGGGLFGLDIGLVGSVLDMKDFRRRYRQDPWQFGLISSGMNIGAFLFCGAAGYLADRFGRRRVISCAAAVFSAMAFLQGASSSVGVLFLGRVVSGGAIGITATITPLWLSEMAPPNLRGSVVSLQQSAIGATIMLTYWFALAIKGTTIHDWRICFYASSIPALALAVGLHWCPSSPRWLLTQGRAEEARQVLVRLRTPHNKGGNGGSGSGGDQDANARAIADEFEAIVRQLDEAKGRNLAAAKCGDLCSPSVRFVTIVGFLTQFFQNMQGINVIMYFGPMVVDGFGLDGNLFTGVVQTFNFFMTFFSVAFVDKYGRRPLLMFGTAAMMACMLIIAAIGVADGRYIPATGEHVLVHRGWGYVCVLCFVVYLAAFAATWGPVGWLIPSEIFPQRLRSRGIIIAAYANWSSNALLGLLFPSAMKSLGFKTYFVFAFICIGAAAFAKWMLPETKGVVLEDMEALFKTHQIRMRRQARDCRGSLCRGSRRGGSGSAAFLPRRTAGGSDGNGARSSADKDGAGDDEDLELTSLRTAMAVGGDGAEDDDDGRHGGLREVKL